MELADRWARLRYEVLLPVASRRWQLGRVYAEVVGAVEFRSDPARRRIATARAARWLGGSLADGRRVFARSLVSEALEEADCAYFMRDGRTLLERFRVAGTEPAAAGGVVWATLHLGSPILAYVYLRCVRGIDLTIIGRRLDDTNPMPAAKRRFGTRKVAWLEQVTARPLLGVDARAMARARTELLEGHALYVAIDVPGDVSARAATVEILGEPIRLAAGIFRLASLTGASLQPVVAFHRGGTIEVQYGERIAGRRGKVPWVEVGESIGALVRRFPDQWWLWPYVTPAAGRNAG